MRSPNSQTVFIVQIEGQHCKGIVSTITATTFTKLYTFCGKEITEKWKEKGTFQGQNNEDVKRMLSFVIDIQIFA